MRTIIVDRLIMPALISASSGLTALLLPAPPRDVGGRLTIRPPFLLGNGQLYPPAMAPGSVAIAPAMLGTAVVAFAPRIIVAPTAVTPPVLLSTVALFPPSVQPGGVAVAPAMQASTAAPFAPDVRSAAAGTILPPFVASSGFANAPAVQPGTVAVQPAALPSAAAPFAPTIQAIAAGSIAPALLASSVVLSAPTVQPGAVSVLPGLLASASALYAPMVQSIAANSVQPALLPSAAVSYAPTIAAGLVTITPAALVSGAQMYAPMIQPSAATVAPPALATTASFYALSVLPGVVAVAPPLRASGASLFGPVLLPGSVVVMPPQLASTALTYPPSVTAAAAAPTALIYIGLGDSKGVGVNPREAQDTRAPNTYNARSRSPAGISTSLPYDQAIAPDGNSYLSPYEYFAKQVAADTGLPVIIIPHNWNGTSIFKPGGTQGEWGVGATLHESLIDRCNGTGAYAGAGLVKAAMDAFPGAAVAGMIRIEGTNDAGLSGSDTVTQAAFFNATVNGDADFKARIFANGVSGATIGNVPTYILGLLPETIAARRTQSGLNVELGLRQAAAAIPNGVFYKSPEGVAITDNLHETLPGVRNSGTQLALLRSSTTPVTILNASTFAVYEGQKVGWELLTDQYAYLSLTGPDAAKFMIDAVTDTTDASITSGRIRYILRFAGDVTKTYASPDDADGDHVYQFTINALSGGRILTTKAVSLSVVQAYGQVGTVAASAPMAPFNVALTGNTGRDIANFSVGAGMNQIVFRKANGPAVIQGIWIDGIYFPRHASSTNEFAIIYAAIASARTVTARIATDAAGSLSLAGYVETVTGTTATPTEVVLVPTQQQGSPHAANVTTPVNGLSIAAGLTYQASVNGPVSGSRQDALTNIGDGNIYWAAARFTAGAGQIGFNVGGTAYMYVVASSWAKA
ncbi:hypothetical protein [Sphingomonas beigongshangi]|uniref:hypothetical protein n=1 Tax=Sphingomonas beigongshangi TaxID=2782540 RepID=UPI00193BD5BA|nr:hypothetical protein [Sphingomonas beigongshangi]